MDAITSHHAAVSEFFFTGVGMELTFHESEILVDVLQQAKGAGIVVLPIHDGVIVPRSQAPTVKNVMEVVFMNRTGLQASVTVET